MYIAVNKDGHRVRPTSTGERGFCPLSGAEVISKCGEEKVWHWAYRNATEGYGYKPMTQWHLDWQNNFKEECLEKIMTDSITGERHIADLEIEFKCGKKMVVEFQNSPIKPEEVRAREGFYNTSDRGLIWIFNGDTYAPDLIHKNIGMTSIEVTVDISYLSFNQKQSIIEELKPSKQYSVKKGDKWTTYFVFNKVVEDVEKSLNDILESIRSLIKEYQVINYVLEKEGAEEFKTNKRSVYSSINVPILIDFKGNIYRITNDRELLAVTTKEKLIAYLTTSNGNTYPEKWFNNIK